MVLPGRSCLTHPQKPGICTRDQGGEPCCHSLGSRTHPAIRALGRVESAFPVTPTRSTCPLTKGAETDTEAPLPVHPQGDKSDDRTSPIYGQNRETRESAGQEQTAVVSMFVGLWSVGPGGSVFLYMGFKKETWSHVRGILLSSKTEGIHFAPPCKGVRNVTFLFL